jgi:hypothetical protein
MSIVQCIVLAHGGTVRFDGAVQTGTTVEIERMPVSMWDPFRCHPDRPCGNDRADPLRTKDVRASRFTS